MLEIQNLSFSYGAAQVFDNISMSIPESRVTCIIGRNGVGKTTLLMNIMGALKPDSGTVYLGDVDVTHLAPDARARAGLGPNSRSKKISVLDSRPGKTD
jgi:ABC-type branched-subunit amino acid transport system ATPase component